MLLHALTSLSRNLCKAGRSVDFQAVIAFESPPSAAAMLSQKSATTDVTEKREDMKIEFFFTGLQCRTL